MSGPGPLPWPDRARLWDAVSSGARSHLRGTGLLEVSTPARVLAPAIEPWIEPLAAAPQWLRTSPELALKRLLARGVGSCFELAKVWRAGEIGDWHREEFHLLEWYRVADTAAGAAANFERLREDVEALVAAAATAREELGLSGPAAPARWETWTFDAAWHETTGQTRPADALDALREAARGVSGAPDAPLLARDAPADDRVAVLAAWSELFSWWSDGALDPWLERKAEAGIGIHIVDFPAPLAALAEIEGEGRDARARRFESFIGRVELANGYLELRDPRAQRERFARVAAMRAWSGLGPLPLDEGFLSELGQLPPVAGIALGFERLLAWCTGVRRLSDLALEPDPPRGSARG